MDNNGFIVKNPTNVVVYGMRPDYSKPRSDKIHKMATGGLVMGDNGMNMEGQITKTSQLFNMPSMGGL